MLETACRSPGGQPRKIAGKFCVAGNPAGKFSCQKNTLADRAFHEVASKLRLPKITGKFFLPGNRAGNFAVAGKKFGEILAGKNREG